VPANHGADKVGDSKAAGRRSRGTPTVFCNKLQGLGCNGCSAGLPPQGPREDVLHGVVVDVQLEAAGGAAEGGLIRPAFRVDVAASGANLADVARVHSDHHPSPLLPLGFEHGLDLPQAGIPEAAIEPGFRCSLIRQERSRSILGGLRLRPAGHAVVVQLLHRHRAVGPQDVGGVLMGEALTGKVLPTK